MKRATLDAILKSIDDAVAVERGGATAPLERVYSDEGELIEIREHGVTTWRAGEPRASEPPLDAGPDGGLL